MAARFLGKTSLADLTPLRVAGRPVLEHYETFRSLLMVRLGPECADLLAEPIVTWSSNGAPGSVSWYAEATGEAAPLRTLPADRQQRLSATLRNMLNRVAPLLHDPELGPALQAALVVASADGIRAVDDRVVLTDWGLTAANARPAGAPLAQLAASPLGAFMTIPEAAAVPPLADSPRPAAPLPSPPPPPPTGVVVPAERSAWNWWLLPAGLVVAVLFLILGLWLGARMVAERVAERPSTVSLFDEQSMQEAIDVQRKENAALEHQVDERRRALEGDVCRADPGQMPNIGPNREAAVPPAAVPPPPGGAPFRGSLADLLKQAVVLIIAPMAEGASTGSGFFIAPDLIATNRHVIEHAADPNKILVTNKTLGHLTVVHVIAETPDSNIGDLDIAVLRLDTPAAVQPLSLTTAVTELDPVIAAGYPQLTTSADEAYDRLLHSGDVSAVPSLILTDGKISAIQETLGGIKILPHTAPISPGNSGGPLVDACGRVVGVNTFIASDQEHVAAAHWAQKIDQVAVFLNAHGVSVTPLTEVCSPQAPQAAPAPPAPLQTAPVQPMPAQSVPAQPQTPTLPPAGGTSGPDAAPGAASAAH